MLNQSFFGAVPHVGKWAIAGFKRNNQIVKVEYFDVKEVAMKTADYLSRSNRDFFYVVGEVVDSECKHIDGEYLAFDLVTSVLLNSPHMAFFSHHPTEASRDEAVAALQLRLDDLVNKWLTDYKLWPISLKKGTVEIFDSVHF